MSTTGTPQVQAIAAPGPAAGPLLEVSGLAHSFGETRALTAAELTIGRGEIHALAGENGSGKTTLIKVLSGILVADAGEVRWEGTPMRFRAPRAALAAGISTVFQETLIAPELSVRNNIYGGVDGLFRRRLSSEAEYAQAAAMLDELGLAGIDLDRPLWSLTLAERQIVTIARAMVRQWKLLVLDEATSALDARQRDRLFAALRAARERGHSVLFTSHRMDEVTQLADSVSVLRLGATVGRSRIVETTPREILALMADEEELNATTRESDPQRAHAPQSTGTPILQVIDLVLSAGGEPLSITVACGEILGLAGLEGHGQLEFIEAVSGVRAIAGAAVSVADASGGWQPLRRARDARRLGVAYVPRDRKHEGLFFPLSIIDNFSMAMLASASRLGIIRWRVVRARFEEISRRLRLTRRRQSDLVGVLSGGNQQKVLLGRWLAVEPRILVLNDPLRGVDANTKHDLYGLFRELAAEGLAIILLSTEILELLTLCDRIAVFNRGSLRTVLASDGASEELVIAAMFGEDRT